MASRTSTVRCSVVASTLRTAPFVRLSDRFFDLRRTIPDRVLLHNFISSSTHELLHGLPDSSMADSRRKRRLDGRTNFPYFCCSHPTAAHSLAPYLQIWIGPILSHVSTLWPRNERRFNIVEFPSSYVPNEKAFDLMASEDFASLWLRFPSLDRPNLQTRKPRRPSS